MVKLMVSRFSGKIQSDDMGGAHFLIQVIGFSYWNPWWRLGTAVRLASSCRWIRCSSYPRCTAPSRADAPSGSPQSSTISTTSRFLKLCQKYVITVVNCYNHYYYQFCYWYYLNLNIYCIPIIPTPDFVLARKFVFSATRSPRVRTSMVVQTTSTLQQ